MKLGIFLMLKGRYDRIEYKGRKVPDSQLNKYADNEIKIEHYQDENGVDEEDNPIIIDKVIVTIL